MELNSRTSKKIQFIVNNISIRTRGNKTIGTYTVGGKKGKSTQHNTLTRERGIVED